MFGSDVNGNCTNTTGNNSNICIGTSVLNDGDIPVLSGISSDNESLWAAKLFTMERSNSLAKIIISFEVEPLDYDHVETVLFNCPELGISAPFINIYSNRVSFRVESADKILGDLRVNQSIIGFSCSHLIRFCFKFSHRLSDPYFNFEFPDQNNTNSSFNVNSTFVFLGEVTFLEDGKQCDLPMLITHKGNINNYYINSLITLSFFKH